MNPIETEGNIRSMELLMGSRHSRGSHILSPPERCDRYSEFAVETYVIDDKGRMSVTGHKWHNQIPIGYDFQI